MIVKCPQCKISYYETTESFNPDVAPNGAMLRLRDPWRKMGWYTYGLDRGDGKSLLSSDMECVGCSAPLAPSGRLTVVPGSKLDLLNETVAMVDVAESEVKPVFKCNVCQKECKSALGLNSHKRSHKEKGN